MQRHASVEALDIIQWRLSGHTAEQAWEPLTPMSIGRSGLAAGLARGNRLIAAGGRAFHHGVVREAEVLNVDSASDAGWVSLQSMHEAREYAASAVVDGDEFWVFGGGGHGGSNTVEVLDLESGCWRQGPAMRMARWGAGAVWHDGRIFVAGGSTHFGRRQLTTLEVLDPREAGEWQLHSFPTPQGPGYSSSLWGASMAARGHNLFLCGGVYREAEESQQSIFRIDLRMLQLEILRNAAGQTVRLDVPRWCGGACLI